MRGEGDGNAKQPRAPRRKPALQDKADGDDARSSEAALSEFARSRRGVEGYIEPPTNLYRASLLLIAGDGAHLRRPVTSPAAATELCRRLGIPVYDARKVGYPRRMHDAIKGHGASGVDLSELPPWPTDAADTHDPRRPPDEGRS